MIAFRATNPLAMGLIVDDLEDVTRDWYYSQMINNPNDVCVIIVLDGKDVVGHILSRITNNFIEGSRYIWIDGLSQDTKNGDGFGALIQSKDVLLNWGRDNGITQIRGQVKPDSKIFAKGIYGTKEYAKIFVKEI